MNPLDIAREKLEACFIFNSYASENIRQLTGIRMLSQVWIDMPAWYFWLHEVPGAFMMEAFNSDTWEHDDTTFDSARFIVRYFPATDSELMVTLTAEEKCMRNSSMFDQTGTPVYEQLHVARQGFFECAVMEYHFSRGEETVLMLLETKAPLRGTALKAHCTDLYESLAGMYALYYQETPGASYLIGAESSPTTLHALYFSKGGSPPGELKLEHYLGIDSLAQFRHHPDKKSSWRHLALIKPESMGSSGCGCCCGQ